MSEPFTVGPVLIRDWIYPGWNRRRHGHNEPIDGWRYLLHRILWGYSGLTYVPAAEAWTRTLGDPWKNMCDWLDRGIDNGLDSGVSITPALGINFVEAWPVPRG